MGFGQVAPVKGFNRASPVSGPTFVDATIGGKRLRRGARLWTVAVSTFKAETYRFLRQNRPTPEEQTNGSTFPPGTLHLPGWADSEWTPLKTSPDRCIDDSLSLSAGEGSMSGQPGFFDLDEHYRALSKTGDPLERLASVVDFEIVWVDLDAALRRSDRARGGRPPMDAVMMFKVLVIQSLYGLAESRPSSRSATV